MYDPNLPTSFGYRDDEGRQLEEKGKSDCKAKVIRKGRLHNLQISLDYDTDPAKTYPVLLFTPHMRNTAEHHHIELNKTQATVLRDYLSEWLKPKDRK